MSKRRAFRVERGLNRACVRFADERGASFLIALLFFLITSSIAAIILMAASANVERVSKHEDEEQAYLMLSSAALMLQDDLSTNNFEFSIEDSRVVYQCRSYQTLGYDWIDFTHDNVITIGDPEDAFTDNENTYLSALIGEKTKDVYRQGYTLDYTTTSTFDVTFSRGEGTLPKDYEKITATLMMDKNYNIQIELASGSSEYRYTVVLDIPAQVENTESNITLSDDFHMVKQRNPYNPNEFLDKTWFATTRTFTNNMNVTWGKCSIFKGSVVQ